MLPDMPHKSTGNILTPSWKQLKGHTMMLPHSSTSPVWYIPTSTTPKKDRTPVFKELPAVLPSKSKFQLDPLNIHYKTTNPNKPQQGQPDRYFNSQDEALIKKGTATAKTNQFSWRQGDPTLSTNSLGFSNTLLQWSMSPMKPLLPPHWWVSFY